MCVQYIGGYSVHQGVFSTWGDIMSTSGDVQYIGGYHVECGGYHEYTGRCSVHQRDIMIHVGEQLDKILSISIENSDVLNIPDVLMISPPMYSWYPPDVLMVSLRCTEHPPIYSWYLPHVSWYPRCTEHPPMYSWYPLCCTHGIPPMYWTSPNVLMVASDVLNNPRCTHDIPRCMHGIPQCTHGIPQCTHGISPMYSWYPPNVLMVFPNVLNTPRCTEHPLMYWTHIIQGDKPSLAQTHHKMSLRWQQNFACFTFKIQFKRYFM